MPIIFNDSLQNSSPKPIDNKYGVFISGQFRAYLDVDEANSLIAPAYRYIGLTVLIRSSPTDIEYWYEGGTTNVNLVLKRTSSGISGYSGKSGFSGSNGVSGFSGTNGASGVSGFSGQTGPGGGDSGFSGTSGKSGFSGTNGTTGVSGFSGQSGFSGSGVSGFSGSGISGFSGTSGAGVSGFSGTSGTSGKSGYSGFSGAVGPGGGDSGFSGTSGQNGASGTSGFSGTNGASGTSGKSGFSGQQAASGVSGYSGSGVSGFSGGNGSSGVSGYSGAGVSGFSGTSGVSGQSGVSGYSGRSGFSGTSGGIGGTGISGTSGVSGYSGIPASLFLGPEFVGTGTDSSNRVYIDAAQMSVNTFPAARYGAGSIPTVAINATGGATGKVLDYGGTWVSNGTTNVQMTANGAGFTVTPPVSTGYNANVLTMGTNASFNFINELKSLQRFDILAPSNDIWLRADNVLLESNALTVQNGTNATSVASQVSSYAHTMRTSLWNSGTSSNYLSFAGMRNIASTSAAGSNKISFIGNSTNSLLSSGTLLFSIPCSGIPTYADNITATAGGLVTGDLYKTSTGSLQIVL